VAVIASRSGGKRISLPVRMMAPYCFLQLRGELYFLSQQVSHLAVVSAYNLPLNLAVRPVTRCIGLTYLKKQLLCELILNYHSDVMEDAA
jgi:hypothetical protein